MLPRNKWANIRPLIKIAGENGALSSAGIEDDFDFLVKLGVLADGTGVLSDAGLAFFEAAFIRCDGLDENILKDLLIQYAPTEAVTQYLWGVKNVSVDQVLVVLKVTKLWPHGAGGPLTHFLDLLNMVGIIKYNRKLRKVEVLISPEAPRVPRDVFIDPSHPYSNIMWIRRILGECEGAVYWLDKHFQKEGLEWLWAIADANCINKIWILSLDMGDVNLGKSARKEYKCFKKELASKEIDVEWRTIDSKLVRDSHDRWVMDDAGYARNIPNVGAISSGQRSEMTLSDNYEEIRATFDGYWEDGKEVGGS